MLKQIPTFVQDPATGALYISREKQYVRHLQLGFDQTGQIDLAGAGLEGSIKSGHMTLSDEFHFEAESIIGESDGPYSLSIYWQMGNSDLMNKPVENRLIVGNGYRPFKLPTSLYMRARSAISFTLQNLGPSPNRIRIWLRGRAIFYKLAGDDPGTRKLIDGLECKISFPYFLSPDDNIFLNTGNVRTIQSSTMTIDPNLHFETQKIQGFADNDVDYNIVDPVTARQWANKLQGGRGPTLPGEAKLFGIAAFVPGFQGTGSGWAQYSYILDEPLIIFPNAKLNVTFEDTTGVNIPNRVRFVLPGRYIRPGAPLTPRIA